MVLQRKKNGFHGLTTRVPGTVVTIVERLGKPTTPTVQSAPTQIVSEPLKLVVQEVVKDRLLGPPSEWRWKVPKTLISKPCILGVSKTS